MVALIPARAGSKRVPGKNIRPLAGRPLIAYTIAAAKESATFESVYVCSDDSATYPIAQQLGVIWWPRESASDTQADIEWAREWFGLTPKDFRPDAFAILRPTSPFRTAATIKRAYDLFASVECDSIRAVEPVQQHPGKMWWVNGEKVPMTPVCDAKRSDRTPWHSCPTQTLPPAYVQNASLEMAWTRNVFADPPTISGTRVVPFFTEGVEGLNIDTEADWLAAERAILNGHSLPKIEAPSWS